MGDAPLVLAFLQREGCRVVQKADDRARFQVQLHIAAKLNGAGGILPCRYGQHTAARFVQFGNGLGKTVSPDGFGGIGAELGQGDLHGLLLYLNGSQIQEKGPGQSPGPFSFVFRRTREW